VAKTEGESNRRFENETMARFRTGQETERRERRRGYKLMTNKKVDQPPRTARKGMEDSFTSGKRFWFNVVPTRMKVLSKGRTGAYGQRGAAEEL
jgi:hypothetical protein